MGWERAAVGALAVLVVAGLVILGVKMIVRMAGRSAKQETRADVMEATLDARKRFDAARSRNRELSRNERDQWLLDRASRRRASGRVPPAGGGGGPGNGEDANGR